MYPKDLDPKVVDQVWERFLSALDPLTEAGKLGAMLFQFPPWFTIGGATRSTCWRCKRRAARCRSASSSATSPGCRDDNVEETLDFLTPNAAAVRVRGHAAGAHVVDPAGGRGDG